MMRERLRRAVSIGALLGLPLAAAGTVTGAGSASAALSVPTSHAVARTHNAFSHPLRIDARYFPLRPGTEFVYTGTVKDAEGSHRHRVIFIVTDLVKRVGGIDTRVILDRDVQDGRLTEAELAFFAQDDHADVWTMGEYPEEYENGKFTGAPNTWISGQARAQAGILVPGRPRVGTPPFVQGEAPAIHFLDIGRVIRTGERVTVPVGTFSHVVVIDEFSPLDPASGHQQKFYASGVGLVNIAANSGDSQEVLPLTLVRRLSAGELAVARAVAVRLDRHAYQVAPVYRSTPPAHR